MKHYFLSLILSLAILLNAQRGYACPFESTEHADLLAAVRSLDAQLRKLPGECLPGGSADVFKNVADLQTSSTHLQQMWGGQAPVAAVDPTQFGMNANMAMNSIASIGNTLKTAASCKQIEKDGLVTILSTVSDISMSLAPVLMAATVFLPVLAGGGAVGGSVLAIASKLPVGKFLSAALLLGVFSTVAEVSVDLFKNETLKMSEPTHRALVLKSICEYRRIKTNVDYLSYINTGRANIPREKQEIDARVEALRQRFQKEDSKMVVLIDKFYAIRKQVDDETRKIAATRTKLAKINTDLMVTDDKYYRCDVVASRVASGTSLFTHLALPTPSSTNVTDKFSDPSYAVQRLANAIKINESTILKMQKEQRWIECSTTIDTWKKNVDILLGELTKFNREKAEQQMGALLNNPSFVAWRQQNKNLESDSALLERIIGFMSASPDPRQIIPETDLIIEVQELGRRIFKYKGWNVVTGKSLAGAWLDHRIDKYTETVEEFDRVYSQLSLAYFNAYTAKEGKYKVVASRGMSQSSTNVLRMNLSFITADSVDKIKDTKVKGDICRDLNALNIHANNAGKLLNSANYFCRYLEDNDLKNADIDPYIVSKCWGQVKLGSDKNNSSLERLSNTSRSPYGMSTRAVVIAKKLDELKCAQPSRPKE